jgi:Galactose oxidase, central domain
VRRISKLLLTDAVVALGLFLLIIKAAITQTPTCTWAPAGNGGSALSSARSGARTVQLRDGRLLITGGSNGNGAVSTADFFDMAGNFAPAPTMNSA